MRKVAPILVVALGLIVAAPANADTNRVGWWHFNEGAGTFVGDASSYGNNGTLLGAAQWTGGVWGSALNFDGISGRVDVPDSSSLEPSSTISVAAWVKGGPQQSFVYIVSKGGQDCSAASYGLYTGPSGGLMFYVSQNQAASFTRSPDAGTGVWDGSWHYAVGTYDGSAVRLYVDGQQIGSGTPLSGPIGYGLPDNNDLFVGHYPSCSGYDFVGSIDEPEVWTRALSPSEVVAAMHPFTGFFDPVDNLPTVNTMKAGSAVPVKFSLGGDMSLSILAAGSPTSHQVSCSAEALTAAVDQTMTAGASTLQYDPVANQYTYVWKTDKNWAGTCRQFDLTLNDGTTHSAMFSFTK